MGISRMSAILRHFAFREGHSAFGRYMRTGLLQNGCRSSTSLMCGRISLRKLEHSVGRNFCVLTKMRSFEQLGVRSVVEIPRSRKSIYTMQASIATSAPRYDDTVDELGPPLKRPRRYLDMKTFRKFLKQQKTQDIEREKRAIAQLNAKPPPEGWGILEFLNAAGVGDGADLIADSFGSWEEFISSTIEELYANNSMTNKQRRIILKHITLFNHGLWPHKEEMDYMRAFQAPPLKNEGNPWTEADDAELRRLAEYYDADFGDPWLYISWEMQRTIEDVQQRYIDLVILPKYCNDTCDIAVTKAYKPLLMNRKFKLDPPYLYIIPSEQNFPLAKIRSHRDAEEFTEPQGVFSESFLRYRRPECFRT